MQMYKGPKREYPLLGYVISYSLAACLIIYAVVSILDIDNLKKTEEYPQFENTTTFSNDNFSVDYPQNWKLSKEGNAISIISKKDNSGYKDNITVQIQESSFGKAPTADSLSDSLWREMSSYDDPYMSNYEMVSSKPITHQNYKSAEVISKFTVRKIDLDISAYNLIVPVGKNVFMVTYATPYNEITKKQADLFFEKLISTFQIK